MPKKSLKYWFTIIYHNYWSRASAKISAPIYFAASIMTFLGVYLGVNKYVVLIGVIALIAINLLLVIIGWIDYSVKGTKVMESYESMKADYEVYFYYCIYKQLERISEKEGIEMDPELKNVIKFLERHSKHEKYKDYIDRELHED